MTDHCLGLAQVNKSEGVKLAIWTQTFPSE